jgi:preprotein translocase SecF subunit
VVGATLGQTEISRAMHTMGWTMAVMFLFLGLYYRRLGMVAIASVLVNGMLTWTTLAIFGSTLTLPGIAGLILSLAMGIDTNILIYERIREEMRDDKGLAAAIEAGYARAFLTVIDSHLTTISAALVLYMIGSGPIKGFGLTLMIGIGISLFSGIYVGRMLTDSLFRGRQTMNMSSLFKPLHVGYVRLRHLSYALTILTAIVGIGYFAFGHNLHKNQTFERNFDIEFTGGTMVQVSFAEAVDATKVEAALEAAWQRIPEDQRGASLIDPREVQKQPYFQSLAQAGTSSRQWVFRVRDVQGAAIERERHALEQQQVELLAKVAALRDQAQPDPVAARKIEREELAPLGLKIKDAAARIADRTDAFKRELSGAFSGLVAPEGDEVRALTWNDRTMSLSLATLDPPTRLQAEEIGKRLSFLGRTVACREDAGGLVLDVTFAERPKAPAGAAEALDPVGQHCSKLLEASGTPAPEAHQLAAATASVYETVVNVAAGQRVAVAQPFPASQHFSGQVADRMKIQALAALGIAMIAMMIYIAARFEMAFGLGAVVSLLHVVIQTLGVIALMGIRIDLTIVAAFLTIVGYAINDTIVTYDRIRENLGKMVGKPLGDVIDQSIAEVMPRTILTGGHVAVALLIMIIFGGASLQGFCTTLLIGILLGTYSSVFVASPLLMTFRRKLIVQAATPPAAPGAEGEVKTAQPAP